MGAWGEAPWDNDRAADWFGGLFDATRLRDKVVAGLESPLDDFDTIRAAAHVLIQLGHVYVWPIDSLTQDLELAASRLEQVLESADWKELTGGLDAWDARLRSEIATLRSRIEKPAR